MSHDLISLQGTATATFHPPALTSTLVRIGYLLPQLMSAHLDTSTQDEFDLPP